MLLKSMLCPASMLCSTTADLSGWPRHMCLICSLHLVSLVLPVCLFTLSRAWYPMTNMLKQSDKTPIRKQGQTSQALD
jgi:hypothetical protein